jgi:aminoglycoside phosphotransferase (APT) family kinase protein
MSSVPSYVLPPLDEAQAVAALRAAGERLGLDPAGAVLIRLGSNAVFRLAAAPVIVRIARHVDGLGAARRQVEIARWLAGNGIPVVTALDVEQPLVVAGRVVTVWKSVSSEVAHGTTAELGALLRRLHALPAPDIALPAESVESPSDIETRVGSLRYVGPDDRRMLVDRMTRIVEAYRGLSFELPPGPIHGDASVGNLLRGDDGRAVLSDLDAVSVAPREWDLVQTAMYHSRFGWHTEDEYRAFADAYGHDLLAWPGFRTMADLREARMVLWLAGTAETDPTALPELRNRLQVLREDTSRRSWRPR